MGFLYKPNVPKFKDMDKFKGRMFHSARWEQDYDYKVLLSDELERYLISP